MAEVWRKNKLNVKIYRPVEKIELRKEQVAPLLSYFGMRLSELGGFITFFIGGALAGVKGFFSAKDRIRQSQMKHERVLDLRKVKR
jgi:hypothetical protein